jgi:hypothetical protein
MLTANPGWVVPAGLRSRRFFVLRVSDDRIDDFAYFKAIRDEMEGGGYEALLYDLLHFDLRNFNVRSVPRTEALIEQRKKSLEPHLSWWSDVLHRGYVFNSKHGLGEHFTQWHDPVSTELLYKSYEEHARARHERNPLSRGMLGRFLAGVGGKTTRPEKLVIGEHIVDHDEQGQPTFRHAVLLFQDRPRGYAFGGLNEARKQFLERTGLLDDWDDGLDDDAVVI